METMGAVIQQSFVMERAQAPALSGLWFLLPRGFWGTSPLRDVALPNRYG